MTYKMLVLDMDDTLLNDQHQISDKNKKMLQKAKDLGIYIVLASGRPTPAMIEYAKELQLMDSYMISYNGAVITDLKNNEILFEQNLTKEQIHALYDFSKEKNTHIITYLDGNVVSETTSEYIDIELNITQLQHQIVPNFKEHVQKSAIKCILLQEPSYLKNIETDLLQAMPHLSICMSKPFFLEVAQTGIDKGASVAFLAKKLQIKPQQIIAVGNAGNDLSMIQYAGLGVWVDNVDAHLRHHANTIVASNNHDGVAEVIEKYILN